jgi:molybdopterin converting factor small subunit
VKVLIPSPLLSYTRNREVAASGATLGDVLADLERQFPGIRHRMIDEQDQVRPHMRIFVNGEQCFDLRQGTGPRDVLQIVQALSGG